MRVLYDGVIYRIQHYGGVVRYFNGLIHNLPESIHPTLLATSPPSIGPTHPNLKTHIESCGPLLWPIKPLRKQIIARRTFQRLESEKPDVFHPTYYYSSLRHLFQQVKVPTVVTVYDLIHERFPAQMDPKGKQRALKIAAQKRADAIICISHSTKRDLLNYYSIAEEKLQVVHLGCDFDVATSPPQPNQIRPYLLYVGGRDSYKNFNRFLSAFASLRRKNADVLLRCIGGKPFSPDEKKILAQLDLEPYISNEGFLDDFAMKQAYSGAIALVYPSLYEGFGIPILEAMHCGTAVITSNQASMPEVAGDAAILFDPYSVESMAASMERIFDSETRGIHVTAGLQRASHFSWSKAAAESVKVYEAVSGLKRAAA